MRSRGGANTFGTSTGDGETTQAESTSPSIGGEGITYNKAPEQPNVFSDGSLKQRRLYIWQTGGAIVWWPGRREEYLTEEEKTLAEYEVNDEVII